MFTLKEFLLTEAKTQTKTDTTTDWASIFKDMQQQGLDRAQNVPAPVTPERSAEEPAQQAPKRSPFKVASGAQTRARAASVAPSEEMNSKLSSIDMNAPDDISDADARRNASVDSGVDDPVRLGNPTPRLANPNPTQSSTMPAMMSKALTTTNINPEWHAVKHLPGYLASGIRQIGRAVFKPFTDTPIEEINVLANVNDSGPNDQEELDAVLTYLQKNGSREHDMEMQFNEKIPGYNAQLRVFVAMGHVFVTVKDFAGKYIYSWPQAKGDLQKLRPAEPAPRLGVDRPRLR